MYESELVSSCNAISMLTCEQAPDKGGKEIERTKRFGSRIFFFDLAGNLARAYSQAKAESSRLRNRSSVN